MLTLAHYIPYEKNKLASRKIFGIFKIIDPFASCTLYNCLNLRYPKLCTFLVQFLFNPILLLFHFKRKHKCCTLQRKEQKNDQHQIFKIKFKSTLLHAESPLNVNKADPL